MSVKALEWVARLQLKPLSIEGGWYRETARSDEILDPAPGRYDGPRSCYSAIYYMLTPETFSAMHRLKTDEIWHFYAGDPVLQLQLFETGTGREIRLSNRGEHNAEPQAVVPRRVWQGARLEPGGTFALLGTTLAPGFELSDFELGDRAKLVEQYPTFRNRILTLTRPA